MALNAFYLSDPPYGHNTFMRQAPGHVDVRSLAASTPESHTVPTGARYVVFSADGDFYAKPGGTAAAPAGDVTDGSGSELNPVGWDLKGVASVGLVATGARIVTLSFYA